MKTNNQVFLLTENRNFGENCYKHLCTYDPKVDVTLFLNIEKSLESLIENNQALVITDRLLEKSKFNLSLRTLVKEDDRLFYLLEESLNDKTSEDFIKLDSRLQDFFKVEEEFNERIQVPDILGIGASTGGPAALLDLFAELNAGLPFPIVLVNHIPPGDFAQSLADSLTYNSKIKVHLAQHGMIMNKGEAYLCPGGKHLTVKKIKGKMQYAISLNDQAPPGACTPSIDLTFQSMSLLKFTNTAAIVLTGMGRDGTKGALEMAKNNGCIYAQNPDKCLIKSMPTAVVESGCCSKILDLKELAYHINKKIFSYKSMQGCSLNPFKNKIPKADQSTQKETKKYTTPKSSEDILNKFIGLLEKETANMGRSDTPATLKRKLESLLPKFSVKSFEDLYELAYSKNAVRQSVIDCLTNHETFFFRDHYPYQFIENIFIPEQLKKNMNTRIWSAACSTGQEPYSISMTLCSNLEPQKLSRFSIMASDISRASVRQASQGYYSESEVRRGLPSGYSKFFRKANDCFELQPGVKKLIDFRHLNLGLIPADLPKFDLIFLRYVLIYFDEAKKVQTLSKIINHLKPGGYLILDPATSLRMKDDRVKPIRYKSQIIFKKGA